MYDINNILYNYMLIYFTTTTHTYVAHSGRVGCH